ncbi:hypothetical protein KPB2_5516 [Klebsiella pneumoniae Kb677]|nr:hypothetical protein KPB2_5516 [Klebsiella pneumoniae Kb677]
MWRLPTGSLGCGPPALCRPAESLRRRTCRRPLPRPVPRPGLGPLLGAAADYADLKNSPCRYSPYFSFVATVVCVTQNHAVWRPTSERTGPAGPSAYSSFATATKTTSDWCGLRTTACCCSNTQRTRPRRKATSQTRPPT